MADRLAENGAIQYALANPENGSKRSALSGYIMAALNDWLKNPFPPLSRLAAPGRLRGQFFDSGVAPLAMDFANEQYASGSAGNMSMKSFSDIVTFSRTSNATVTRSDGTIGFAPHNLLTFSEQFDNAAWSKTRSSISANNVTAPDGTITADKLIEDTTTGTHFTSRGTTVVASTPTIFSIYLKKSERTFAQVRIEDSLGNVTNLVNVNLTTGEFTASNIGSPSNPISKVENVGNDWWRVSVGFNVNYTTINGIVYLSSALNTTSYTGNGASGLFVWGAQFEYGSTATTYNPTTVKNLLGFTEAFENAAWTKSNSFVQTNLLTYSEDFSNAAWINTNLTVASNSIVAPNGYQTADTLTVTTTSGTNLSRFFAATSTSKTLSVYAKKGSGATDGNKFGIRNSYTSTTLVAITVNYDTGAIAYTVGSTGATCVDAGNGWWRITVTADTGITAGNNLTYYVGFTGVSETAGKFVYLWGAQVVQGSTAGDYRRTDAAALPVFYPNHNGVVCAQQIQSTAGNGTVLESYTASGVSMTFSIWMRRISGTGNVDITMDSGSTWTTQAITSSWARYSITSTPASGARTAGVRLVTSGNVIQVFGAQVSPSASLDPYVLNAGAAPSAQAYYGPRFDYDPVTLAPKGLLIEEQRSNLLLNSSLAGTSLATQNVTVTAVAHTLSFYGTGTVTLSGTATATVNGTGAYPTRTTLTFTPTAGTLTVTVSGTVQFAQLEAGAFATSYIPTAGSTVTRAADVAVIQGSNFYSWYNQNEGTVYCNAVSNGVSGGGTSTFWAISDNTINNRMRFNSGGGAFDVLANGTTQASIVNSYTLGTLAKVASAYTTNSFNSAINNTLGTEDTSGITPIVTQMQLGNLLTTRELNGTIKQLSYFNTRLQNSTLQGLTA